MSTLFLRNQYLLFLTIAVVVVAGVSAVLTLPRQEDPRITLRRGMILTRLPGASASRVEALVTEKLEDKLQEISEIKHIQSTSRAGISVINIELLDQVTEQQNDAIFADVRDKLAAANLPPEASEPDLDDQRGASAYTYVVGFVWNQPGPAKMNILNRMAEDLSDRWRQIPGTEYVRFYGEPTEEVTVTLDRDEVAQLGLTAGRVAALVKAADTKVPAGTLHSPGSNLLVEVEGELTTLARIQRIPLAESEDGTVVHLGDVAGVERGWREPPNEVTLINGQRTLLVAATVQAGQQVDAWTAKVREVTNKFRDKVGKGIEVREIFDQSGYTIDRLLRLTGNLVAGAGVVMLVVFVAMGWRAGLLVGSALPLSVAVAMFGLLATGGALHQMSIFGMIIALGLLIDNAIVVVDEIRKRREAGDSGLEAVRHTVDHLFVPLLASSFTTVLAFAPIMLLPGDAGDFVGLIGGCVMLAILASFLISMTVVASLTGLFGGTPQGGPRRWWRQGVYSESWIRAGEGLSVWTLRRPLLAMALASLPAFTGFAVASQLGNQFFPKTDRDMCEVKIWLPRETSMAETQRVTRDTEEVIREHAAVTDVYWQIGNCFPSVYYNQIENQDNSPFYGHAIVRTTSPEDTKRLIPILQAALDRDLPEAQVVVKQFAQGPPSDAGVEFRLFGPSDERLQALGDQLRQRLQAHPDVLHTRVTIPRGEPKLWFEPDEDAARQAGLTLIDMANQLDAGLEGKTEGSLLEGPDELSVRVRYRDEVRQEVSAIAAGTFVQPEGELIPLTALGTFRLKPTLGSLSRYDGLRCNIIKGYCRNGALPIEVANQTRKGFERPQGYEMTLGGDAEQQGDAVGNLLKYAPVLVTIGIATIILVFRSLILAGVLAAVAFMSIGLGLLATWAYGLPFSFNTILGSLGLIGVAINDSIVVLAAIRANPLAAAGYRPAIVVEVISCARHVFSTTLTTIGGFLPLLIFVGGDFWPALAIVLAGGVGGATILALVFVPAAYSLFHRLPEADEVPELTGP